MCVASLLLISLVVGIVVYSENIKQIGAIENIKRTLGETIKSSNNTQNDIKIIDVTGIELGTETQHEHVYKTMYDETKHWEECIVCQEIRDEKTHTLTTTWALGNESCKATNSYTKTCICGYSETGHKPCVWDGNSYTNESTLHHHIRNCSVCGGEIKHSYYLNKYGKGQIYSALKYDKFEDRRNNSCQYCYKKNGTQITCENIGTCTICKMTYTEENKNHRYVGNFPGKEGKVVCAICLKEFGTFTFEVKTDSATTPCTNTTIMRFKLTNGLKFSRKNLVPSIDEWKTYTQTISDKNEDGTEFTVTTIGVLKQKCKEKVISPITLYLKLNGKENYFGTGQMISYKSDSISPTISNITSNNNSLTEWSKNKTIIVFGTENWTNTVNIIISDDEGKKVYEGSTNVTNGNYSISCTPELEAGLDGRTFKVTVTDSCENSTEQEFTISKIDSIAPEITSRDKVSEEWAKEKNITFTAVDNGIGNVEIAFNDVSDYNLASKNGIEYSREYKLTGDVYSTREANVYYKDELGNVSTKKVKIDKIDNTSPTITGVSFSNNKLNITANDRHATEGEGSGVSKYRFITSTTQLENPKITIDNSTEVLVSENIIIPEMYKVKYVYVVAEDLVGNVSDVYEVEVPQLELISKVNLTSANGKGAIELDWSSYDISNKYFVIYRKEENETEWKTLVSLEEKFNGNKYTDTLANDKANPSTPTINIEGNTENNSIEITTSSEDNGTKYMYYIESYDSTNTQLLLSKSKL